MSLIFQNYKLKNIDLKKIIISFSMIPIPPVPIDLVLNTDVANPRQKGENIINLEYHAVGDMRTFDEMLAHFGINNDN